MPPFDDPINGISTVKVGDKIRVTYVMEGKVEKVYPDGVVFYGGEHYLTPKELDRHDCTLEILERAKPVWQYGDVVLIKNYMNKPIIFDGRQFHWPDGSAYDPRGVYANDILALVLRDGKPVEQA